MKKRAVFLDRDGTINEDVGYPKNFSQIKIYSYSYEAIRKINQAGFLSVIVTNQSGIGRGFLTEKDLNEIHQKMRLSFSLHNAYFDAIYYCPHYDLSTIHQYRRDCSCRKPNIDMAIQAATDLNLDLENSYMVGDKVEDIVFGQKIKATPILVLTGFGQKSLLKLKEQGIKPAYTAQNLLAAVNWIFKREKYEFPFLD